MGIDVKKLLHMKEGTSETSYAKSSYIQVLSLTKPIKDEAIRELYYKQRPRTICIADLGCSSAETNTLGLVSELIAVVEEHRKLLGDGPLEYHVCLNDLPMNDFNTLFRSLGNFEDKVERQIIGESDEEEEFGHHCFVNGVPGSFYGRLFPSNSLHFVHSSYSLMWLSQVPKGVEENKGNIYISRTSPPRVIKAFCEQFEQDFKTFLRCRSKEVIAGGRMVLTLLGRTTVEPYSKESCYMWELLATVLNDMVSEGRIDEEKLNTFNIPQYNPSATEVQMVIEKEGSFTLNRVDVSQVYWKPKNNYNTKSSTDHKLISEQDYGDFTRCMRSVAEPLLISHFGQVIIEEVFQRYMDIVRISMANQDNTFVNITVAMTKKG